MKKKINIIILYIYSLTILLIYLKIIPNPTEFSSVRYIMLKRRGVGWWEYNLIPFSSYFHMNRNFPNSLWLIIGNILLLMIFGVLLSLAYNKISKKRLIIISSIFSLFLEVIQFILAVGVFDIDAVIQHIFGAAVGIILIHVLNKFKKERN